MSCDRPFAGEASIMVEFAVVSGHAGGSAISLPLQQRDIGNTPG